jgi:hypothetical protein
MILKNTLIHALILAAVAGNTWAGGVGGGETDGAGQVSTQSGSSSSSSSSSVIITEEVRESYRLASEAYNDLIRATDDLEAAREERKAAQEEVDRLKRENTPSFRYSSSMSNWVRTEHERVLRQLQDAKLELELASSSPALPGVSGQGGVSQQGKNQDSRPARGIDRASIERKVSELEAREREIRRIRAQWEAAEERLARAKTAERDAQKAKDQAARQYESARRNYERSRNEAVRRYRYESTTYSNPGKPEQQKPSGSPVLPGQDEDPAPGQKIPGKKPSDRDPSQGPKQGQQVDSVTIINIVKDDKDPSQKK